MKEIWIQAIAVTGYSFTAIIALIWRILKNEKPPAYAYRYDRKRKN